MERLKQEIDELSEVVATQKKDLKRHKIYQMFMERVLEKSDEVCIYTEWWIGINDWCECLNNVCIPQFDEAHEIIARHDTLKHTREVILKQNLIDQVESAYTKNNRLTHAIKRNNRDHQ